MYGAIQKLVREVIDLLTPTQADRLTEQYEISYNDAIKVMHYVKDSKTLQDTVNSLIDEAIENIQINSRKEDDLFE